MSSLPLQGSYPNLYTIDPVTGYCSVVPPPEYLGFENMRAQSVAGYTVFGLVLAFSVFSLLAYYVQRNTPYLRKRSSVTLLALTSIGGMLEATIALREGVGSTNWPCRANLAVWLIIPFWIAPMIVRMVSAYNRELFYERVGGLSLDELEETMIAVHHQSLYKNVRMVMRIAFPDRKATEGNAHRVVETFIAAGFLMEHAFAILLLTPFLLLIAVKGSGELVYHLDCHGCMFSDSDYMIFGVSTAVLVLVFSVIMFRLRRAIDPLGVIREVRISVLLSAVFAGSGIVLTAINVNDVEVTGIFTFQYLVLTGYVLIQVNQVVMPVVRTLRRLDPDTSGFQEVLDDEALRAEFADFVKLEMSSENLRFVEEVERYKKNYGQSSAAVRCVDVRRLVAGMVVEGALLQINIPHAQRSAIEEAAKSEDPSAEIFDDALHEVKSLMARDTFPRFRNKLKAQGRRGSKLFLVAAAGQGV